MFYVSLLGSIMVGASCGVCDATVYGILKGYPNFMIGYYCSGAGFGGILGCILLLGFKALKLPDYVVFLSALPLMIPFFFCFYWLTM